MDAGAGDATPRPTPPDRDATHAIAPPRLPHDSAGGGDGGGVGGASSSASASASASAAPLGAGAGVNGDSGFIAIASSPAARF